MYANKNKNQYTTLIHEGENITIDPPGFINAEGGGGGGGTVDPVTPFNIKHNGQTVASVNDNGDLTLEGTVYINGDTDIQELTPIYTADIIGDYENNTFTSSASFADITEALETGHTLIARDTNGFVYFQTASEFDPETTDSISFASVQPDGVYLLTWTGTDKLISKAAIGGVILDWGTQLPTGANAFAEITEYLNSGIIPIVRYSGSYYNISGGITNTYYLTSLTSDATSYNYAGLIGKRLIVPQSGNIRSHQVKIPGNMANMRLFTDGTHINTKPTGSITSGNVSGTNMKNFILNELYEKTTKGEIVWEENGNAHFLKASDFPVFNNSDSLVAVSANTDYKFAAWEPFSNNTIICYEVVINFSNVEATPAYTATYNTYTYTIGA